MVRGLPSNMLGTFEKVRGLPPNMPGTVEKVRGLPSNMLGVFDDFFFAKVRWLPGRRSVVSFSTSTCCLNSYCEFIIHNHVLVVVISS